MQIKKRTYILGIVLGVSLMIAIYSIFSIALSSKNKKNSLNLENEIAKLKIENDTLQNENLDLKQNIENLEEKSQSQGKEVIIEIKEDMTNDQIADELIKNKIYSHKDDIMMLLELINIDNSDYTLMLEIDGIVKYGGDFILNLNRLTSMAEESSNTLVNSGYVQDKEAFEHLLYLENYNQGIKRGNKTFKQDSSLREISNILTSD